MARKFLPETIREQFVSNIKAMPRELGQTLTALFRQGLKDLQNVVLNPFPEHHVATHEEPGTLANPTQLEVSQEREEALAFTPATIKGQELAR